MRARSPPPPPPPPPPPRARVPNASSCLFGHRPKADAAERASERVRTQQARRRAVRTARHSSRAEPGAAAGWRARRARTVGSCGENPGSMGSCTPAGGAMVRTGLAAGAQSGRRAPGNLHIQPAAARAASVISQVRPIRGGARKFYAVPIGRAGATGRCDSSARQRLRMQGASECTAQTNERAGAGASAKTRSNRMRSFPDRPSASATARPSPPGRSEEERPSPGGCTAASRQLHPAPRCTGISALPTIYIGARHPSTIHASRCRFVRSAPTSQPVDRRCLPGARR